MLTASWQGEPSDSFTGRKTHITAVERRANCQRSEVSRGRASTKYRRQLWTKASISKVKYHKDFCRLAAVGLRVNKTICSPTIPPPLDAIWAGRPPCTGTVSMNAAVVVVVVDCRSRHHVKHRSNREVRAEEAFFSYPRIPPNPHTHPTVTAIEFSWKGSRRESREEFQKGMTEINYPRAVDLHTVAGGSDEQWFV